VPETLSAGAPAKINLVLEVCGKREDGYHELSTVLQTLELADTVTLSHAPTPGVTVSGPYAPGTPADATNLAWRAAEHLAQRVGGSVDGLHVHLEKHIPAAGGLGGGASDAATTLRLLQRWWPRATDDDLLAAANAVGSDEAFFLCGGTALATGRGESVWPLPGIPRHGVVLFIPATTLERKTARVFAALAGQPFDDGSVAAAFAAHPPAGIAAADVYNAFERVALDLFPGLAALWEALEQRTGDPVRLAGAGPTLFWIGSVDRAPAIAAAGDGLPCTTVLTATAPSLWRP
jgi:4-diphosphocytidyl-2-C-methyl-D-erythritol kinase